MIDEDYNFLIDFKVSDGVALGRWAKPDGTTTYVSYGRRINPLLLVDSGSGTAEKEITILTNAGVTVKKTPAGTWQALLPKPGIPRVFKKLTGLKPYTDDDGRVLKAVWATGVFSHTNSEKSRKLDVEAAKQLVKETEFKSFDLPLITLSGLLNNPTLPRGIVTGFDIEVSMPEDGHFVPASEASQPVLSVAFAFGRSAGETATKTFIVAKAIEGETAEPLRTPNPRHRPIFSGDLVIRCSDERELISLTYAEMMKTILLCGYNSGDYDLPYLKKRGEIYGISPPFETSKRGIVTGKNFTHIDLLKIFSNFALKTYAFGSKYQRHSLDAVSKALLPDSGGKNDDARRINEMSVEEIVRYNKQDAILTLDLAFEALPICYSLSRILQIPISLFHRTTITYWVGAAMTSLRRSLGLKIPKKISREREERFEGAVVFDPVPGVHRFVTVMDFASLYPSIINIFNLCPSTMCCSHDDCQIPDGAEHKVCSKKRGVASRLIGFLRNARVKLYKRNGMVQMAQALKVLINGWYGAFAYPNFRYYSREMAETVTAIGRDAMKTTKTLVEKMDIALVYGDTDSVFLADGNQEKFDVIIETLESKYGLELEVEKTYKILALGKKKKNYIGVFDTGYVDIKGLRLRKRDVPAFVRTTFDAHVTQFLSDLPGDWKLSDVQKKLTDWVKIVNKKLNRGEFLAQDCVITTQISKKISEYKTRPPHIRAAQQFVDVGKLVPKVLQFVWSRNVGGVRPIELWGEGDEIDWAKYKTLFKKAADQVLGLFETSTDVVGQGDLSSFLSGF